MLLFKLFCLFGIVFGFMLIAYENGVQYGLLKKLLCRIGIHKIRIKLGKLKINKYYCQHCKKPRKHPKLTMIGGGNKWGDNNYKF